MCDILFEDNGEEEEKAVDEIAAIEEKNADKIEQNAENSEKNVLFSENDKKI